ncbi:MAG: AAA family ATPase [Gammaproteobacteria bacterium]|nr:AAA family ATPase [Gammaproteobacteria bacterium]
MSTENPETSESYQQAARLITSLLQPAPYPHPVNHIEMIETHISWVILTGSFVYKIKKPVNLGFVDYTDLKRREYFCHQELQLNRRLAPKIYLAVVPITGPITQPSVDGDGSAIEFAVKMHQFPQGSLLNRLIENKRLTPELVDHIAHHVAHFHTGIEVAGKDTPYGSPEAVLAPMQQNFSTIRAHISNKALLKPLEPLEQWTYSRYQMLETTLRQRKNQGFIRECHGDMHLGNIALIDKEITIFDGIEFNEQIRWIDVISELAFLVMDLDDRGTPQLGQRLLNHYLQETGDYGGLALLRFYQVYRAMVKAKVNAIRLSQGHLATRQRQDLIRLYRSYTQLAISYTGDRKPALIITHGLSGSGKSTLCQQLAEQQGFIWIRSDVERKRLYGLEASEHSRSEIRKGLYTEQAGKRTYKWLLTLANRITDAGFTALVDATFLRSDQRSAFIELANSNNLPWWVLNIHAIENTLRRRIQARLARADDPSEASLDVLTLQLRTRDPLNGDELKHSIDIDSKSEYSIDAIKTRLE